MTGPWQIHRKRERDKLYLYTLQNSMTGEVMLTGYSRQPVAPLYLRKQQARLNTAAILDHGIAWSLAKEAIHGRCAS